MIDETVKSLKFVMPVKTGIQNILKSLDTGVRRYDKNREIRPFTRPS